MYLYILRRALMALMILVVASFIVYMLMAQLDPLATLRESSAPNKEALMAARSERLDLYTPPVLRFFKWLGGAASCLIPGQCNLGLTVEGQPVTRMMGSAVINTFRLVTMSTLLAILLGITVGITTALRQYSSYDYGMTFVAFLCFSLPSFWLAVLLKEFGAIRYNDFLQNPTLGLPTILIAGLVIGAMVAAGLGGTRKRLAINFAAGAGITVGLLTLMSVTKWFSHPQLGIIGVLLISLGAAVGLTILIAGLRNRKALHSALATAVLGAVLYFPIQPILNLPNFNFLILMVLGVVAVGVGVAIGHFMGGYDRSQNRTVAGLTAFISGFAIALDKLMLQWPSYVSHWRIGNRPIKTFGATTVGFDEGFWQNSMDSYTHVVLPTMVLLLIAFASYARFTRASLLEVLNQDYVRTARAKGLSERVVVVRHAFRNALIPLATVVASTIGGLVGGATITEQIFGWSGMGTLFYSGLLQVDPNPVMGVFLISATMTMVFILVADLLYSILDPRVRVK